MVPLTINCWPSISGNESYVNIEYECQVDFDLQNIVVAIPCHQPPKVNQVCCLLASQPSQLVALCISWLFPYLCCKSTSVSYTGTPNCGIMKSMPFFQLAARPSHHSYCCSVHQSMAAAFRLCCITCTSPV